jgi:hypothetical protein
MSSHDYQRAVENRKPPTTGPTGNNIVAKAPNAKNNALRSASSSFQNSKNVQKVASRAPAVSVVPRPVRVARPAVPLSATAGAVERQLAAAEEQPLRVSRVSVVKRAVG